MISILERLKVSPAQWDSALSQHSSSLRVSIPGIIQSFDSEKQTATVQIAINEVTVTGPNAQISNETIELLSDVPVSIYRAGGFSLTLPVQAGDECLLVFSDADFGAWWQSGGVQNQITRRRHDISDAIAIIGLSNQTRTIQSYSTTAAQLRSDDGQTVIEVGPGEVTIKAQTVNVQATGTATVQGETVNVTGSSQVNISGNSNTHIDERVFLQHIHTLPTGGTTGPVV